MPEIREEQGSAVVEYSELRVRACYRESDQRISAANSISDLQNSSAPQSFSCQGQVCTEFPVQPVKEVISSDIRSVPNLRFWHCEYGGLGGNPKRCHARQAHSSAHCKNSQNPFRRDRAGSLARNSVHDSNVRLGDGSEHIIDLEPRLFVSAGPRSR